MAERSIRERPVGKALASPVMDQDDEPPAGERLDGLEILLDRLGSPGTDDHRTARLADGGKQRRA